MKPQIYFIIIVSMLLGACAQNPQKNHKEQVAHEITQNPNLKLQVYYFHTTRRCLTCNTIEANMKHVLENEFQNEMDEGVINFSIINVDEAENRGLAEKYQATGAALHLIEFQDGLEKDNDLTRYAFANSRKHPEIFLQTIRDTISFFIR